MSDTHDSLKKLVDMANQIAEYFKIFPQQEAARGVADHIQKFWTPKMRIRIIACLEAGNSGLEALAADGVNLMKGSTKVK